MDVVGRTLGAVVSAARLAMVSPAPLAALVFVGLSALVSCAGETVVVPSSLGGGGGGGTGGGAGGTSSTSGTPAPPDPCDAFDDDRDACCLAEGCVYSSANWTARRKCMSEKYLCYSVQGCGTTIVPELIGPCPTGFECVIHPSNSTASECETYTGEACSGKRGHCEWLGQ